MTFTEMPLPRVGPFEWVEWRSRVHAGRWLAFSDAVANGAVLVTPLMSLCPVPLCPGRMHNVLDGMSQECDMTIMAIGNAVYPPGSTAGMVVKRENPEEPFKPVDLGVTINTVRDTAALEMARILTDMVERGETPATFQEAVLDVIIGCWSTMMQKRHQRGVANLMEQGQAGILSRVILDKGQRLLRESKREQWVSDGISEYGLARDFLDQLAPGSKGESFDADTDDCINYLILLRLLRLLELDAPFRGETY